MTSSPDALAPVYPQSVRFPLTQTFTLDWSYSSTEQYRDSVSSERGFTSFIRLRAGDRYALSDVDVREVFVDVRAFTPVPGLGNHVVVDHVINGQKVQSVYGHMLDNSFQVTVGETVKVTQTLGLVGSTGESTGAHPHLEIHINGVPVDPFAWLKANAN